MLRVLYLAVAWICACVEAAALPAPVIVVAPSGHDVVGCGSESLPCLRISFAVQQMNATRLQLRPGHFEAPALALEQRTLSVSIHGSGAATMIVSSQLAFANVTNQARLSVSNLTLLLTASMPAFAVSDAGQLSLTDVTALNITTTLVSASGDAVVLVRRSRFVGNVGPVLLLQQRAQLNVSDSGFVSNVAWQGAAVRLASATSSAFASRCQFDGNRATDLGGAFYSSGRFAAEACSFTRNSAKFGGAGAQLSHGNAASARFDSCECLAACCRN